MCTLREQIRREHEEVCRHLQDAQLRFAIETVINLATGYTGCDKTPEREFDLTTLVYESIQADACSDDGVVHANVSQGTHMPWLVASVLFSPG